MAKQFYTPLVINPSGTNTSGLQLAKLLSGGAITSAASPIGVDSNGNVVLVPYPAPNQVTLEITIPLNAYSFFVSVPSAVLGQNVLCSMSGVLQSGAFADEYEMEPMNVFATVYSAGFVVFTIACTSPFLLTMGRKTINFYLG